MQYWRLYVSAVTKRVTTVLVRLYNVFATVPCTVAVSKCGRMLSPRSVWATFKVQEVKSSGTNHGTSLCSLAPRCLFSCPHNWLACFFHVIISSYLSLRIFTKSSVSPHASIAFYQDSTSRVAELFSFSWPHYRHSRATCN